MVDVTTLKVLVELSLANPLVVGLLLAVFRNILGYLENYSQTRETYEKSKLFETLFRDIGIASLAYLGSYNPAAAVVVVELLLKVIHEAVQAYKK